MSAAGNVAARPRRPYRPEPPGAGRFRALGITFGVLATLAGCLGVTPKILFSEPSTLKYALTVIGPVAFTIAVALRDPLKALFALTIIVAPFDFVVTFQGLEITPIALVGGAAFALMAVETARIRLRGWAARWSVFALVLVAPAVVRASSTTHYVLWIGSGFGVALLAARVARHEGGREALLRSVAISAFLQSTIAIWEFVTNQTLNLYSGSTSSTVANNYFFNFAGVNRPAGALPDPISLGNVLAMSVPLVLVLMLKARTKLQFVLYSGCELVIVLALALTLSRDSWIGAALSMIVLILLVPGDRFKLSVMLSGLVFGSLSLALSVGGSALRERFFSILDPTGRNTSTANGDKLREYLWAAAEKVAAQHRAFGIGFGRLQAQLAHYVGDLGEATHSHNTYLQVMAEAGLFGIAALVILILACLADLWRGRKVDPRFAAGVAASIVAMLVCWTTDYTIRYIQVCTFMATVLACAASMSPDRARPTAPIQLAEGEEFVPDPGLPPVLARTRRLGRATAGIASRGVATLRRTRPDAPAAPMLEAPAKQDVAPPAPPPLTRRIGGSAANFAARRVGLLGISAIGTLLVTKFIGPIRYGDYASAIATWTIVSAAGDFGFSLVVGRDLGKDERARPMLLRASYEVGLAWAAALTLGLVGVAFLADVHTARGQALLVLAPSVLAQGVTTGRQVFLALYRSRELVMIDLIVIGIQVVITVAVAAGGGGAVAIAAVVSAGTAINAIIVGIVARRIVGDAPSSRPHRRQLIRNSLPLGLMSMMVKVYLLGDLVILGWLVTGTPLGNYAAASKMLTLAASIPALVTSVALPGLAATAADRIKLERLAGRLWEWMLLLVLPVVVMMLIFPDLVIRWTVGSDFIGAVPLLRILAVAGAIGVMSNLLGTILVAKSIVRPQLWYNAVAIALNVVANLALVPTYGVTAAAWATVVTEAFICTCCFVVLRHHLTLKTYTTTSIQPVAAALGSALLGWASLEAGVPAFLGACLAMLVFCVTSGALRFLPGNLEARLPWSGAR